MEQHNPSGTLSWRDRAAPLAHATRTVFADPVALRGLLAAIAGTIVLLLPNATTVTMTVVVIVLLALSGLVDLSYAVTGRRRFGRRIRRSLAAARGLAALLFAAFMVVLTLTGAGRLTLPLIGGVIGVYVGIRGLISVISAILNRRTQDPALRLAQGGVAVVIGVLSVTVPESVVSAAIVTAALGLW